MTPLQSAQTVDSQMHEKGLAPYMPGRAELAEFAARLKQSLSYRGAEKLTDHELLALAAASRAHGLNPYLGEIWAIPGKGLMIGRAGWVKKINEKFDAHGITWWPQYLEVRPHEREQYGVPADAKLAYICELRREDTINAYISSMERMHALGMTYDQISPLLGNPPVIKGVGYIGAGETEPGQTIPGTTSKQGYMSFGERCKKRSFAQACKEIVDLPFNVLTEGDIIDGMVMDGYDILPPDSEIPTTGTRADTFPFPPDQRLCELWASDWTAFWPFMQKHTMQKNQAKTSKIVHAALGVQSTKDCQLTFSDALAAVDDYMAALASGQTEEG